MFQILSDVNRFFSERTINLSIVTVTLQQMTLHAAQNSRLGLDVVRPSGTCSDL